MDNRFSKCPFRFLISNMANNSINRFKKKLTCFLTYVSLFCRAMCDIYIFNTDFIGVGDVAPWLWEITILVGEPLFCSQNLHSKVQPSAIPAPGGSNSLLPSVGTTHVFLASVSTACMWYTYRCVGRTHKHNFCKNILTFNFLYVYVSPYRYGHISMGTQRGQELLDRVWDPRELELQVVVRAAWCKCRNWMLALCKSSICSSLQSHLSSPRRNKFNQHSIKSRHMKTAEPGLNNQHEGSLGEPTLFPKFYSR